MGQPAARLTDLHVCPMVTPGVPPIPHVGGPIAGPCSPNVLTGKLPQARVTDLCMCVGPPDVIVKGSATVFVNTLPAARLGDMTAHGGVIVVGMPTVLIGDGGSGGGGGGGGGAPAKKESRLSAFFEWTTKASPFQDEAPETSRKLAIEYKLLDPKENEWQLKRIGDEDNFIRLGTLDADAKASASYDIDKGQFEAGAEAGGSIGVLKEQAKIATEDGAASATLSGEALTASAKVGGSVSGGKEGFKAQGEAGAEAVLVKAKAEGEVRITPKTVSDRLFGTNLPASWDKGIVVGGSAEVGVAAAAKAKGEVVAKAGEWSMSGSAKLGAGPAAGLGGKIGLVW